MKKNHLWMMVLLFAYSTASSQNKLQGKISDNKNHQALADVSVYIPDLKLGLHSTACFI